MRTLSPLLPYLRLMRLNQPTGIWLLLFPCWWAVMLATEEPSWQLMSLLASGAVVMRSAGCIINDIADREFDKQVERTKNRPLASGEVSMKEALILLALLLCIAFDIALMLGTVVVMWAALALIPVVLYPLTKRISWWPQLFLGLTFNWGALLGFAAARGDLTPTAFALYIGCVFWTLGYDTIYAHQDKIDDARIGIKSTALRLGQSTTTMVGISYILAVACWVLAARLAGHSPWGIGALTPAAWQLAWQIYRVNLDDPASCRRVFISNVWVGWLVLAAFALS